MPILQLQPFLRDTIWGGQKLRTQYGMQYPGPNIAEAWVLSCHKDGQSTIKSGAFAGQPLADYIAANGRGVLGSYGLLFDDFPILIKFIDAAAPLSIQVHPSNKFAMEQENQYGKTEMWYILQAEPGAYLYYGFEHEITEEEFARRIAENTLTEVLHRQPVKPGECYFIPSGTLHAIGAGITLAEIQQNSNITYRVYDYGRTDAAGHTRELHLQKAEEVTKLEPAKTDYNFGGHLVRCEYFTVDVQSGEVTDVCNDESFTSLLVLEGESTLTCGGETVTMQKGDSLFLPADSGIYHIAPGCKILKTRVGTI